MLSSTPDAGDKRKLIWASWRRLEIAFTVVQIQFTDLLAGVVRYLVRASADRTAFHHICCITQGFGSPLVYCLV